MVQLKEVQSSNLEAIGHDPASNTLAVKFRGKNEIHHYADVPVSLAESLQAAESVGKFFAANVRGKFSHQVIES